MRRAGLVAAGVLLLALMLGLARMNDDIDDEVDAALTLAGLMARLASLPAHDDVATLAGLQGLQAEVPPRHLRLQLYDENGRALLPTPPDERTPWLLRALLQLHQDWLSTPEARVVSWPLVRSDGRRWTVSLHASRDSERAEAMTSLLGMLALLLLCVAGLLLVMFLNVHRALVPLHQMLAAIGRIERHDPSAAVALPSMPVHELERVAMALRHLAQALQDTEAQRRSLGQRVITLQEDERVRLARDLHDEFGQHLAALQADAAWLHRRLQGDAAAQSVADALIGHGRHLQQELRTVLTRLRPLQGLDGAEGLTPVQSLVDLLHSLQQGWSSGPHRPGQLTLRLDAIDTQGRPCAAPGSEAALPHAVALALYRITQEALTNAARHAHASRVDVVLTWIGGAAVEWQVSDDGVGLAGADLPLMRGSGLAGIRERVWALGGELHVAAARPGQPQPGLRLSARLAWHADRVPDQ